MPSRFETSARNGPPAPRAWHRSVRLAGVALTGVALAVLAGCSSSTKATPSTAASTASSRAAGTTGAATATSGASSIGDSADVAAVRNAYAVFFDPKTTLQTSMNLLQDGAAFQQTLIQQGNSADAKSASVSVTRVVITSSTRATVTFTVLLNGSPVLPNQTGYSVREGGTWKVAGATFCGLLAAQGTPPAVCAQPAATALPS